MFFSLNILVFSQHFLINQTWIREIIQQIQVQKAKNLNPFFFHMALVGYHGGHIALFIYLDFLACNFLAIYNFFIVNLPNRMID